MIINIIIILSLLLISIIVEKRYKIPTPLTIILLTITITKIYPNFLGFTTLEVFSEEMLSIVVLLVLVDAFILRLKDLKENWLSIVYLAGIAIILSILSGVLLAQTVFSEYNLGIGAIIALFAMVLATDPVAVVGTMKQYPKLPHKVKFLAEAESLFNDAIALMAFMAFGIYLMNGNEITTGYIAIVSLKMLVGSVIIGFTIGIIGLMLMKTTKDTITELVLILLVAYTSFELAELFHLSGLLAEIVAILTMTTIIDSSYKESKVQQEILTNRISQNKAEIKKVKKEKLIKRLFQNISNVKRQEEVLSFLTVLALFANAILFASLAIIMDFGNMLIYWKEIIVMFLITSIIRMIMMGKFALFSSKVEKMQTLDLKSYFILVFAGIKGGLSIVMLNILNKMVPGFEHFDMYVAIVSGVILLSLIINVLGLTITIKLNEKSFEKEYELEKEH